MHCVRSLVKISYQKKNSDSISLFSFFLQAVKKSVRNEKDKVFYVGNVYRLQDQSKGNADYFSISKKNTSNYENYTFLTAC